MPNPYISGTGFYLPPRVVTNDDLSKYMDTSDQWIQERTGITERRYAEKNEGPSDIAIPAVEMALDNAQLTTNDIDFIIFSTSTPDYYIPGSGCLIQDKMNFKTIGALDIRCQCSGFIYALSIADQYIKSGTYSNILVITSEVQSTAMDLSNEGRDTAIIFADGAAAAVLSANNNNRGILSTHLHTEGRHIKKLWVEAPSSKAQPRLTNVILQADLSSLHYFAIPSLKLKTRDIMDLLGEDRNASNKRQNLKNKLLTEINASDSTQTIGADHLAIKYAEELL